MPTISVIIPTYNNQRTILETIESIQKQSFSDLEIVVINDGSTDDTLKILNSIPDERVKVFTYENSGVSTARNRGISVARGKYIAFLDGDDLWTQNKLELQYSALEQHPEAGLAYSLTYMMSENGKQVHKCDPIYYEGNVYTKLLAGNFIIGISSNILVRKAAIDSVGIFDTTLSHYEDWDWCLRLASKWSFVAVPEYQVFYRLSSGSASTNIEAFEKSVLTVINRAIQNAPQGIESLSKIRSKSIANCHLYWSQLYLTRVPGFKGVTQARYHLLKAARLSPIVILKKYALILVVKLIAMHFLTPEVAGRILNFITNSRAMPAQKANLIKS
ncbi:MAG: glycosyltransferase family 2 protein [Calothrix sp. FI2-JRJ7]|jgi:glycosyltransferase involved in cell wall biosynthesis|nr:glycosyltransferase family 2 protein [Calothrix sp. FI2-JRJ7]